MEKVWEMLVWKVLRRIRLCSARLLARSFASLRSYIQTTPRSLPASSSRAPLRSSARSAAIICSLRCAHLLAPLRSSARFRAYREGASIHVYELKSIRFSFHSYLKWGVFKLTPTAIAFPNFRFGFLSVPFPLPLPPPPPAPLPPALPPLPEIARFILEKT